MFVSKMRNCVRRSHTTVFTTKTVVCDLKQQSRSFAGSGEFRDRVAQNELNYNENLKSDTPHVVTGGVC